jgi:signal transduction histidine kinase
MSFNSLAFRLFATAAAWAIVVLPIAGFIIYQMHKKDVQVDFDKRLALLTSIIVSDSIDNGGNEPGEPKNTGDPLFDTPDKAGWYWQITPLDVSPERPGRRLASTSLGADVLPAVVDPKSKADDAAIRWGYVIGPLGQELRVAEQVSLFGEGEQAQRYLVTVAGTVAEIDVKLQEFRTRITASLALAGLGLIAMTLFQVRFGLHPLQKVEQGLAAIRTGDATRLDGELPAEVVSLQRELNALIKSNEEIIERARREVGNLAHGLKTPLAVLMNEARDESTPLAAKVAEQTTIMRDQVTHYLDRARMAARTGVIGRVTDVKLVAETISRALVRIHREKDLNFIIECTDGPRFYGERQDLEEMLGNLLDNASKWSAGTVQLTARLLDATGDKAAVRFVEIIVEDDGPGLTSEQLAEPIQRGRRLDESKPGSGLGHSIVADLAHSYRGTFLLGQSDLGGLKATLTLPAG